MRFEKATFVSLFAFVFIVAAVSSAYSSPMVGFSASGEAEWQALLDGGPNTPSIRPVTQVDWDNLPGDTKDDIGAGTFIEGFVPDDLYTYGGGIYSNDGTDYDLEGPGLVMAWGPPDPATSGDFISGWVFDYGMDPNIQGATVNVTLFAPQFGVSGQINSMTFGLQSPNAANPPAPFTRSWTWSMGPAPGQLAWSMNHPISIFVTPLGLGGAADATPAVPAAMFADPAGAFDPTNAQWFVAFENATWLGNAAIMPPGSAQPQAWNYWRNLSVAPIPEPGAASMLGLGLLGLAARRRRK